MAYTSIARLAAAAGDADAALSAARKVVDQGLVPRLRTFVPALMAFAAHGQVLGRICQTLRTGPEDQFSQPCLESVKLSCMRSLAHFRCLSGTMVKRISVIWVAASNDNIGT